jgi:hypothetical protein
MRRKGRVKLGELPTLLDQTLEIPWRVTHHSIDDSLWSDWPNRWYNYSWGDHIQPLWSLLPGWNGEPRYAWRVVQFIQLNNWLRWWNGMLWWVYWETKFDHLICPGGDEMAAWDLVRVVRVVKFSRPTNSGAGEMASSDVIKKWSNVITLIILEVMK